MNPTKLYSQFLCCLFTFIALCNSVSADIQQRVLEKIKLPPGFSISLFAKNVDNARSLALGENGVVFVGSLKGGKVYALSDSNGDDKADQRYIIARGLNMPNGVAYRNGSLYVAELNRIIRFDNIMNMLSNPPQPVIVYDQFPDKRHHGWKYLRFGPDARLYTAVGAPCNICDPANKIFTSLVRMDADGNHFEIIARGIRNTVGFDWQPGTNTLFFTDNGRDYLGDNEPPDELNKWSSKDQHFGYPYCHAGDILDPKFGKNKDCNKYTAPEWRFKAHMAPLGIRFYTGNQFPEKYQNQLFVALHGSWNRSQPHGYRISLVKFKNGVPISEQVFATGWLDDKNKVLGRPVDILVLPGGSLMISDDHIGVIYKIDYNYQ